MQNPSELLDLRLRDFVDRLGADSPGPRSGSAAAAVGAMAAALVEMTARLAEDWQEAAGAAAQAATLRSRLVPLVVADAEAYESARSTIRGEAVPDAEDRDAAIAVALARAAEVPLSIAEYACDVAELAVLAAQRGHGDARADAASAAVLAAASARAGAHLVRINLGTTAEDERVARADRAAAAAAAAADRALGAT